MLNRQWLDALMHVDVRIVKTYLAKGKVRNRFWLSNLSALCLFGFIEIQFRVWLTKRFFHLGKIDYFTRQAMARILAGEGTSGGYFRNLRRSKTEQDQDLLVANRSDPDYRPPHMRNMESPSLLDAKSPMSMKPSYSTFNRTTSSSRKYLEFGSGSSRAPPRTKLSISSPSKSTSSSKSTVPVFTRPTSISKKGGKSGLSTLGPLPRTKLISSIPTKPALSLRNDRENSGSKSSAPPLRIRPKIVIRSSSSNVPSHAPRPNPPQDRNKQIRDEDSSEDDEDDDWCFRVDPVFGFVIVSFSWRTIIATALLSNRICTNSYSF